jgi:hypothetical protein
VVQWYRLRLPLRRLEFMGHEIESRQGVCRVAALDKLKN